MKISGQPELDGKFQVTQYYTVRPCLKNLRKYMWSEGIISLAFSSFSKLFKYKFYIN